MPNIESMIDYAYLDKDHSRYKLNFFLMVKY